MDDFEIEKVFEVKPISEEDVIKKEYKRKKKKKKEFLEELENKEVGKEEENGHIDIYV